MNDHGNRPQIYLRWRVCVKVFSGLSETYAIFSYWGSLVEAIASSIFVFLWNNIYASYCKTKLCFAFCCCFCFQYIPELVSVIVIAWFSLHFTRIIHYRVLIFVGPKFIRDFTNFVCNIEEEYLVILYSNFPRKLLFLIACNGRRQLI